MDSPQKACSVAVVARLGAREDALVALLETDGECLHRLDDQVHLVL